MTMPSPDVKLTVIRSAAVPDLDAIYRAHAPAVALWVARLAGPGADVDDLVHEVFLVADRRLSEFRGDGKVTTWLYRIAERVVMDARRRDRFRRWFSRARSHEIAEALSSPQPSPLDSLERRRSADLVYRILDRIPDKYRMVLILFELEEMSGEDVSDLMGMKQATVWVRLHRARALFLREMKRALQRT